MNPKRNIVIFLPCSLLSNPSYSYTVHPAGTDPSFPLTGSNEKEQVSFKFSTFFFKGSSLFTSFYWDISRYLFSLFSRGRYGPLLDLQPRPVDSAKHTDCPRGIVHLYKMSMR